MAIARLEDLHGGDGPLLRLRLGADGQPVGAIGEMRVLAPMGRVSEVIRDINRFAERVPMVHRAHREGDQVELVLRFKIALFGVKFSLRAEVVSETERRIDMRYLSGEPRDMHLAFELAPLEGDTTLVRVAVSYDIMSLGWLVKTFMRHHPEIRFGVYPGTAFTILDALRRAAEQA